MTNDSKAIACACVAVLSWSTVATAFKMALRYLTHFEMLWVASLTSLVIFAVLLTAQRKWRLLGNLTGKQWLYYAGLGLLNPVAYYLVLILLALFAGQPIPKKKYIGMFVSLAGVALISIGTGFNGEMSVSTEGFLLAALSAVLWATYWMLNNRNKVQTDGSVVLFLTFLFGSVYLSVGALFCGLNLSSLTGVLSGMYVGGFEMGIPFIFFGLAMRKTSNPALINQLCYLSPFMSLFFISVVLGEQIVFTTYIGLVMIVLGIVFNQYFVKSSNQAKIVQ